MKHYAYILTAIILVCIAILVQTTINHRVTPRGSLDEQLVTFLQEYIRIDTSHPTPAYDKAISFFTTHAIKDGLPYQVVHLSSGNKALIITYQGSDSSLPALVLNQHMDVVPVTDANEWITPPFNADILDGKIIGRGTQDMKGIGAVHYGALKELKHKGVQPKRTIHLFVVPEEEVGGFKGTKELINTPEFAKLNIGYVIDEGHASGNDTIMDIKVAERKPIQVCITGAGTLAHGSHLQCHNIVHELIQFLNRMVNLHNEQQRRVGALQAGELLSCNISSFTAGVRKKNGHIALNMVPDTAQATIDIRVPPTRKKRAVLAQFETIMQQYPHLSYEVVAQANEEPELADYRTPLYQALSATIEQHGLKTQPHYFEASSDLRYYQDLGIDGVGLTPFTIVDNIHGTNESVPVTQLIQAKNIILQFLKDFCM